MLYRTFRWTLTVPNITVTISGIAALEAKLTAAIAAGTLERAMVKAEARVQATLQRYPSPPAGSTYTRTGDLGRSWVSSKPIFSGSTLIGTVDNAVRSRRTGQPYAQWVQGVETQAAIHAGRWITDAEALQQNVSAIEGDFIGAINSVLG
jgi:hypothetical protein